MRFIKGGPFIPGELLTARDEGRVVFFCGAGVSQNSAKLPDFNGLTKQIISNLGASHDSAAYKAFFGAQRILDDIRKLENPKHPEELKKLEELKQLNQSGLISGDRVFGLLERDFFLEDIEEEVARALKPDSDIKNHLHSHEIILQLARTPAGRTHLVTTNFDPLFENCAPDTKSIQPPMLPNLSAGEPLDGITYLHGRVNDDYSGPDSRGSGFVLTSSQYGRAYLAEGWATSFFKQVLERYTVVFIGYSADDPPVQYLLEALSNNGSEQNNVYAFECGDEGSASAKWSHKGVKAIPFTQFDLLWDTLSSWAERASNPEEWYKKIISKSCDGPTKLEPYERGMVAHIVSTDQGAKLFSRAAKTPPAEWLFVFDSQLRIKGPTHLQNSSLYDSEAIGPFKVYGLDSDPTFSEIGAYRTNAKPINTLWSAFDTTSHDIHPPSNAHQLNRRQTFLASWLCKIWNQIEALQWASHQQKLHFKVQLMLERHLNQKPNSNDKTIAQAWRYLFESWKSPSAGEFQLMPYAFRDDIKNYGWNNFTLRQFKKSIQPHILASPTSSFRYTSLKEASSPSHLLHLDVAYPLPPVVQIPDNYLVEVARVIKQQLELASSLEREIGNSRLNNFDIPLVAPTAIPSWRSHMEASPYVKLYIEILLRLIGYNLDAAKSEFLTWPCSNPIFKRLNIWAASIKSLTLPNEAGKIFCELDEATFWRENLESDLLHSVSKRWLDLSQSSRNEIEERLLQGDSRYDDLESSDAESLHPYKARSSLKRLLWLQEKGCSLSTNCLQACSVLQAITPNTKFNNIELNTVADFKSFVISPEYKHDGLVSLKLSQLISAAEEQRGRNNDRTKENKPFAGLAIQHGWLAFTALSLSAEKNEYPEKAWCEYLSRHVRENANEYPIGMIAKLISTCSLDISEEFIYTVADWFNAKGKELITTYSQEFKQLLKRLIALFHHNSLILQDRYSVVTETDWLNTSLNSPIGKVTETLIHFLDIEEVQKKKELPTWWMQVVKPLLNLEGNLSGLAIARFSCRLDWFYYISPLWTKANLLSPLSDKHSASRHAAWCGFLATDQVSYELIAELKAALYEIAVDSAFIGSTFDRNIAGIILLDWGSSKKKICTSDSNIELRELLLQVDSHLHVDFLVMIESWCKDDHKKNDWLPLADIFFEKVWPRQKCMRTPRLSAQLFELIFSSKETFKLLHPKIIPRLSRLEKHNSLYISRLGPENEIIQTFPFETLQAFHRVLPVDAHNWPYDIGDILQTLFNADESIKHAPEMIELKRKWDSL